MTNLGIVHLPMLKIFYFIFMFFILFCALLLLKSARKIHHLLKNQFYTTINLLLKPNQIQYIYDTQTYITQYSTNIKWDQYYIGHSGVLFNRPWYTAQITKVGSIIGNRTVVGNLKKPKKFLPIISFSSIKYIQRSALFIFKKHFQTQFFHITKGKNKLFIYILTSFKIEMHNMPKNSLLIIIFLLCIISDATSRFNNKCWAFSM